jgi:hypothetical protein
MSQIEAIYRIIAGFDLGGIQSRNLPEIKLLVQQGDCPVRLLMPSTRGEQSFVLVGSTQKIQWRIRDLCLWAPVSEGQGIENFAQPMQDYIVAYLAAIKALYGGQVTSQAHIVGATFSMGPVIWDETQLWAVDTQLAVEEYA